MTDLELVQRWIKDIEINAKGIERDITERDKIFIMTSCILGATMRIKKLLNLDESEDN